MDWSQGDAVPLARTPGPPRITCYPLDCPISVQETQALPAVPSKSPQLLHGAILPVWSPLTFSRNLFSLCYSVPYSLNLISFL